jgi:hypothetical protein
LVRGNVVSKHAVYHLNQFGILNKNSAASAGQEAGLGMILAGVLIERRAQLNTRAERSVANWARWSTYSKRFSIGLVVLKLAPDECGIASYTIVGVTLVLCVEASPNSAAVSIAAVLYERAVGYRWTAAVNQQAGTFVGGIIVFEPAIGHDAAGSMVINGAMV